MSDRFNLKAADRLDDGTPVSGNAEIIAQPRRAKTQLAVLGSRLLQHQDDVMGLLPYIADRVGRDAVRRLYKAVGKTHELVEPIEESVERGG